MRIHAIEFAHSTLPESMVLAGGAEDTKYAISFLLYLIETDTRRILIDAGCDSLPGFEMKDFVSPKQALQDYGVDPGSITDIIVTHAHHDHIDGLRHFPKARIHIQAEEYQKGQRYIPQDATICLFDTHHSIDDAVQILKIGGHSRGSSIALVRFDEMTYVFAGDECYLPLCLEQKIPTGATHNSDASAAFVKEYSKPGYRVLLTHDTNMKTGIIISERT